MKEQMQAARVALQLLLQVSEPTRGMYIRIYGKHLILGREEPWGPNGELEKDDRVRLTRLNSSNYGLSVKRHTGRWEKTPFMGTMKEMVEVIQNLMPHLVAPYT